MKRCLWVLSFAGMIKLLTGCATTDIVEDKPVSISGLSPVATGFINKTLGDSAVMKRYVVYVPGEYTADQAWPMIVFLHGAGERGKDGLIQTEVGLGTAIRRHMNQWPAIVVMPQCPENQFWDSILPDLEQAMANTKAEYRIDASRIYLTGLSMGGYGTWIWGAMKSDTFAALMPICGGGELPDIKHLIGVKGDTDPMGTLEERVKRLATVPIWAFHGADDTVVLPERSREMVKRVEQAGGSVRYTEFPKTGHDSWSQAYTDETAIHWLFEQKRSDK